MLFSRIFIVLFFFLSFPGTLFANEITEPTSPSPGNPPQQLEKDICPDSYIFPYGSLQHQTRLAEKIFIGKAVKVTFLDPEPDEFQAIGTSNPEPKIIVTLSIQKPVKGVSIGEKVVLYTRSNSWSFNNTTKQSSCSGYPFEEGETYVVFSYIHNKYSHSDEFTNLPDTPFDTSIWAGTRKIEEPEIETLLQELEEFISP